MQDLQRLTLVAVFTLLCVLAPILVVNARDRRRAALLDRMWCLVPRGLRDVVAIQVHGGLWGQAAVVEVDMWGCPPADVWATVGRWTAALPRRVRLRVRTSVGCDPAVSLTIEAPPRPVHGRS